MSRPAIERIRGFTLIEVLVALVIVAVGMSALMSALSSSARTVTTCRTKRRRVGGAQSDRMVRLQLTQGQLPPTEKTNGEIELASRTWSAPGSRAVAGSRPGAHRRQSAAQGPQGAATTKVGTSR